MAEKISTEIFDEFRWEMLPATNINWKCINPIHEKKTHPSDVVFTYKEPYKNIRTYINCDLKSYASGSITSGTIHATLNNLSLAISCADLSKEWQKTYKRYRDSFQIVGLLFIYNHDSEFDKNFYNLLNQALLLKINVAKNKKIIVFGPEDICYFNTIVNDIKVLRGDGKIGKRDDCSYYFPDLITKKLESTGESFAATIEMLTSPMQVLRYKIPANKAATGFKIYYRRSGRTIEEFIYLFDYLFHFQIIENDSIKEVEFRLANPDKHALSLFETAKTEYAIRFQNDKEFSKRFSKIKCSTITNVVKRYSEIEIGMRYE
jgi:hypothetical protein